LEGGKGGTKLGEGKRRKREEEENEAARITQIYEV